MRNQRLIAIAAVIALPVLLLGFGLFSTEYNVSAQDNENTENEDMPTMPEMADTMPSLDGLNIYFAEANREISQFDRTAAGMSRFSGLLRLLGANLFTLEWRSGIPRDADLIVIAGSAQDLSANQVARLWAYFNDGGRLLLLVNASLNDGRIIAFPENRSFFELAFADLGLQARDVVLVNNEAVALPTVPTDDDDASDQPIALEAFTTNIINAQHPIFANLADRNDLEFFFSTARPLQIDGSLQDFEITPLLFSTETVYGESDLRAFSLDGVLEYNIGDDVAPGRLILAAAYENQQNNARMVLIGDSDIVRNGAGFVTSPEYSASFVYPDNVRFMLNVTTWLLESAPASFDFPTPAPTATATITPTPTPEPTATPVAVATTEASE